MLIHPQFNPVAISIGPLDIRWYGLMYLTAFMLVLVLGRWRIKQHPDSGWTTKNLDDVLFYGVLGTVLGGRLGLRAVLQVQLLPGASARNFLRVGRRHVISWRLSRRDLCHVVISRDAQASPGSPSPTLSPRWCRSGWVRDASATLSTASCGAGRLTYRGQ